jgi:hypothetical protein
MEPSEFEPSDVPHDDQQFDLRNTYTVPAMFHAIQLSPAARIAQARGTNVFADLLLYVRKTRPQLWQAIVEQLN